MGIFLQLFGPSLGKNVCPKYLEIYLLPLHEYDLDVGYNDDRHMYFVPMLFFVIEICIIITVNTLSFNTLQ